MPSLRSQRPILVVEGAGDREALPVLIRRVLDEHKVYDVRTAPNPKTNLEINKLRRAGELERYMRYAEREDSDGVILALDCDDFCPVTIAREFSDRIKEMKIEKRTAIVLFKAEFESMFLFSYEDIKQAYPEFGWRGGSVPETEDIRNPKKILSEMMDYNRAYKETRDQARFASIISLGTLRACSRSFRHFENALLWLVADNISETHVYPSF